MKKLLQYYNLFLLLLLSCCTSTLNVHVKSFENWYDSLNANNKSLTYKIVSFNNSMEEYYYFKEIHKQLKAKNFIEDNNNPRFIVKANFAVNEDIYEKYRSTKYDGASWWPFVSFYHSNKAENSIGFGYDFKGPIRYYTIYTHSLKIDILENSHKVFESIASLNYKSNNINDTYKFLIDSIFKSFPGENGTMYVYLVDFKTGDIKIKTTKHF